MQLDLIRFIQKQAKIMKKTLQKHDHAEICSGICSAAMAFFPGPGSVNWNCGFEGKMKMVDAASVGWNPAEYRTDVIVTLGSSREPELSGTSL